MDQALGGREAEALLIPVAAVRASPSLRKMNIYGFSKLIHRLTTDPNLAETFQRDPELILQQWGIESGLREVVKAGDLLKLYQLGLHPLLLMQLSLLLEIDIQHYFEVAQGSYGA